MWPSIVTYYWTTWIVFPDIVEKKGELLTKIEELFNRVVLYKYVLYKYVLYEYVLYEYVLYKYLVVLLNVQML